MFLKYSNFSIQVAGTRVGNTLQQLITVLLSIGLAMGTSWKLGAVGIVFILLLNILSYFEAKYSESDDDERVEEQGEAAKIFTQSIQKIKTLFSFNLEQHFLKEYLDSLETTKRYKIRKFQKL